MTDCGGFLRWEQNQREARPTADDHSLLLFIFSPIFRSPRRCRYTSHKHTPFQNAFCGVTGTFGPGSHCPHGGNIAKVSEPPISPQTGSVSLNLDLRPTARLRAYSQLTEGCWPIAAKTELILSHSPSCQPRAMLSALLHQV